jgi:hypothetical protein
MFMPYKIDRKEPVRENAFPKTLSENKTENDTDSIRSDSSEGKALLRVSAIEKGEPVNWVVIEPDESIDIQTVRERIQKRGYKVST